MNEHVINFHITERCNYNCDFCFAKYGLEDQFRSELHNNFERTKSMLWDVYAYVYLGLDVPYVTGRGSEPPGG